VIKRSLLSVKLSTSTVSPPAISEGNQTALKKNTTVRFAKFREVPSKSLFGSFVRLCSCTAHSRNNPSSRFSKSPLVGVDIDF
jgi:hypothetical protein